MALISSPMESSVMEMGIYYVLLPMSSCNRLAAHAFVVTVGPVLVLRRIVAACQSHIQA
jgi:hypothetical protein